MLDGAISAVIEKPSASPAQSSHRVGSTARSTGRSPEALDGRPGTPASGWRKASAATATNTGATGETRLVNHGRATPIHAGPGRTCPRPEGSPRETERSATV